jgi:hypothetical protein
MGEHVFRGYSACKVKGSTKRIALVLLSDAMLCVVLVLMVQIDKLVHGTLYSYGLVSAMLVLSLTG